MRNYHVVIEAHEFSPTQGSECAMGWSLANALSKYLRVTVIAAKGSQFEPKKYIDAYEKHIAIHGNINNLEVIFVGQPFLSRFLSGINSHLFDTKDGVGNRFLLYSAFRSWHFASYRAVKNLMIKCNVDFIHHVNPISFLSPGFLWKLNAPFFLGPVGGMYQMPYKFIRDLDLRSILFELIRNLNISVRKIYGRFYSPMLKKAFAIFCISNFEYKYYSKKGADIVQMIDSSPPVALVPKIRILNDNEPLVLCWSGRHVSYKYLPIMLDVLSMFNKSEKISLHILGNGPLTPGWIEYAKKLGIDRNIFWHGQLKYEEALEKMNLAHVFVHTSIREAASHVVLEAMGLGLPVLCHDCCGMAFAVDSECGIKIPFISPDESRRGFYNAIRTILDNRHLVSEMSDAAIKRANDLSWDSKARDIYKMYLKSRLVYAN